MSKVVVFIRSNAVGKLGTIETIRNLGYDIAIAEKNYINSDNIANHVIDVDTNNIDELITSIAEFGREYEIAAITSFTEFGIEQAATLAQVLGYPGPNLKSVKISRNKYLTRIFMEKNQIPTPKFFKASSIHVIKEKCLNLQFPIIIKPLNFAGACAVVKVETIEELEQKFEELLSKRKDAPIKHFMNDTMSKDWLIEEYLEGFEVSVECFTYKGNVTPVVIHDKACSVEAPYFIEDFFVTPSKRINEELEKKIKEMTKKILTAIGFDLGLSHVEYRITKDGPVLLEINPRQGGILVPESVFYSTGINLPEIMVKMSLGIEPNVGLIEQIPVAFQTLTAEEGRIKKVKGFEKVREMKGLTLVEQWAKEGQLIEARQANYGGAILATGDSIETLTKRLKEAASYIEFEME